MRRRARVQASSGRGEIDRLARDLAAIQEDVATLMYHADADADADDPAHLDEQVPSPGDALRRRRRWAP